MSYKKSEFLENEWSHLVNADDIDDKPLKLTISPDQAARSRLIKRLNILSLDDLEAQATLRRMSGNSVIHVQGHVRADITQTCVVSMEPVKSTIKESFEGWFTDKTKTVSFVKARQDKKVKKGHVEIPMLEEHEDPEPMIDGKIDVGELVTQHVSLAINPYPHAKGVAFEHGDEDTEQGQQAAAPNIENPFAALKDWKDKLGKDES
jgi:uncharacterized metal-binding protein YceD (DUF177 family)